MMILAYALVGFTVAAGAYLFTVLGGPVDEPTQNEKSRRQAIAVVSRTFRWFEPVVLVVAQWNKQWCPKAVAKLEHEINVIRIEYWKAEEIRATCQILGICIAGLAFALGTIAFHASVGFLVASCLAILLPYLLLSEYPKKAKAYTFQVRQRLPFTLDLMSLMLQAGAGTLHECLERAGAEHKGQPLGEEFHRALVGVQAGAKAETMFKSLEQRINDPDVKDMVLALTTAETKGISLKDTLTDLADRMRTRKVQWMEKSAEQAKVKITFPAMVVMAGCMLICTAPLLILHFSRN